MKKSLFTLLLTAIMAAALLGPVCLYAYADTGNVKLTLEKGDTVYSLCEEMGLRYNANRDLIMKLNGFRSEYQLYNIKAGDTLIMPASSYDKRDYGLAVGDTVKYYVLPYSFNEGDSISKVYNCWGLRYEDYADDIRAINNISNLDTIYIGALLWLPTTAENLIGSNYTIVMSHIMQKGDNVHDIVTGYGLDYDNSCSALMKYNGIGDLTKVKAGQELLIPLE